MITSREVCARANITYRQLDHWLHMGLIECANEAVGSGFPRLYEPEEAFVARVIGDLVSLGLSLSIAAHAARQLRDGAVHRRGLIFLDRGGKISREICAGTSYVLDLDQVNEGIEDALASR